MSCDDDSIFWISIWCYNGGFGGLVWCFNGVLEVMVVVVLFFDVSVWLIRWCYCFSVSLDVEDRYRDEVMGEIGRASCRERV